MSVDSLTWVYNEMFMNKDVHTELGKLQASWNELMKGDWFDDVITASRGVKLDSMRTVQVHHQNSIQHSTNLGWLTRIPANSTIRRGRHVLVWIERALKPQGLKMENWKLCDILSRSYAPDRVTKKNNINNLAGCWLHAAADQVPATHQCMIDLHQDYKSDFDLSSYPLP